MTPRRVVIDAEGAAVSPSRTELKPDIVFIRDDGWTLGAPASLATVAYETWADYWVSFFDGSAIRPIAEYVPRY
jgi:hypothetical protein